MITTTIEWHETAAELPEKSGKYLAHTFYIVELPYSKKHKAFNVQDDYTEFEAERLAIYPNYWANVPELPEKESEE